MAIDTRENAYCCFAGREAFPGPCPWHGGKSTRLSLHFEVTDPDLTDADLNGIAERIVAQSDLLNPALAFDSVGITRA